MPFGVENGLATYQRVITKAFWQYINMFMMIFLNDFTIFSDLPTLVKKLRKCFIKCNEFGISLNINKCAFIDFPLLF